MKALESFASEKSIPLYDRILREPAPELAHALHSVKGLLLLGSKGKAVLSELALLQNDRLQLIISHASDLRL